MADDREVWKRITQGDERAFDDFYNQTAPRLIAFLRHIVGGQEAAEDVAQETYTGIWNRLNGYMPEAGELRAYLYGAARKQAAAWWRKQSPSRRVCDGYAIEDIAIPSQIEKRSIVEDAFQRLPAEQRALLWLREVEGQSYEELAVILEIPIGTVKSRLFAAREALRRIWHAERRSV
ncbi:MAG TPA: RNA polymerase sigma factor [Acidobacteriaceae bacterium]|jgi:RNA polymerase sigma-70 factor (ECF subfamily)|nr:RNA polymerase sigma factor [Acidobacteriaceae bacterium]